MGPRGERVEVYGSSEGDGEGDLRRRIAVVWGCDIVLVRFDGEELSKKDSVVED